MEILEKIKLSNNIKITHTKHFVEHAHEYKYCSCELTYNLLKNNQYYDIQYSEKDKFKIRYLHPNNEKYFICVVIFIVNLKSIRIITAHPEERKKYDKKRSKNKL